MRDARWAFRVSRRDLVSAELAFRRSAVVVHCAISVSSVEEYVRLAKEDMTLRMGVDSRTARGMIRAENSLADEVDGLMRLIWLLGCVDVRGCWDVLS